MAPATAASGAALRAITFRLNDTRVPALPQIVSHLAAGLLDCSDILSQPVGSGKEKSETGVLVHKLKTRVSSLLQDRTIEGRWTAVVLVKTIIELGGWEILRTSEPWVRSLIGILGVRLNPYLLNRFLYIIPFSVIFLSSVLRIAQSWQVSSVTMIQQLVFFPC